MRDTETERETDRDREGERDREKERELRKRGGERSKREGAETERTSKK